MMTRSSSLEVVSDVLAYAMLVFIIHAFLLAEKGSQEAKFSVLTHQHLLVNEETFIILAINNHFNIAITP